jgi:transcriptional regulator with XRE-family HTH domain
MFGKVGTTLEVLRRLRGMSQAEVARAAGIGKSQLSKYENGRELPKLDSLEKVLVVLRIQPLAFFATLDYLDRKARDLEVSDAGAAEALLFGRGLLADRLQEAFSAIVQDLLALHGTLVRSTVEEAPRGR